MAVLEQAKTLSREADQSPSGVVPQPGAPSVRPLTRDLLVWVAACQRSYGETMEVWRTSCPRFSIWEDALDDALVTVEPGSGKPNGEATVSLTPRGRKLLDSITVQVPEGVSNA